VVSVWRGSALQRLSSSLTESKKQENGEARDVQTARSRLMARSPGSCLLSHPRHAPESPSNW